MQNEHSNILSSSSYGLPLSCVCAPNSTVGLNAYGSGISSIPTIGYSPGQSTVFSVSGKWFEETKTMHDYFVFF